jgi:hypothetical protein
MFSKRAFKLTDEIPAQLRVKFTKEEEAAVDKMAKPRSAGTDYSNMDVGVAAHQYDPAGRDLLFHAAGLEYPGKVR